MPAKPSVSIKLGNKTYRMRPNFASQDGIEEDLGSDCYKLLGMLSSGQNMKIRVIATIIYWGIIGHAGEDEAPSLEEIGELVATAKVMNVMDPVTQFLQKCIMTDQQIIDAEKTIEAEKAEGQDTKGKRKQGSTVTQP